MEHLADSYLDSPSSIHDPEVPMPTPNPIPGPIELDDAAAAAPSAAPSPDGRRPENHEKARLWSLEHPRRRTQGPDRESWLAAVRGWLSGL